MFKKITSLVAAIAMTVAGFGSLPAQAVNYVPNADSNAVSVNWSSRGGTGSVISIPTTGVRNASFNRSVVLRGTSAQAVVGKPVTVSYTITGPNGAALTSDVSTSNSFSGYIENTTTQATVQGNQSTPGSAITMNAVGNETYDRATFYFYVELYAMGSSASLAVGNYTISNISIKVDNVAITYSGNGQGANDVYINSNEISVNTPYSLGTTATVNFGSAFDKVFVRNATCIDKTQVAAGDVLTVRHLTDGTVTPSGNGDVTRSIDAYLGSTNGGYVYMQSNQVTVSSEQATKGLLFRSYEEYLNSALTGDSRVTPSTSISTGAHTFGLSVTKADGTEVSAACSPAAPSAPTSVTNTGTSISVTGTGTFAGGASYYCQAFNNATNVAVGNETYANTQNYSNGNYGTLSCNLYGVPGGITIYVKFVAKDQLLSSWKTYGSASQTLVMPVVGYNVLSTASNGTAFGTVKALTPLNTAAVTGVMDPPTVEAKAEPTGGIYEFTTGGEMSGMYVGVRRLTANGLDSSYGLKTLTFSGMSGMPSGGWHGTLAAPRPVVAAFSMANPSAPELVIKDLTTAGAAGNSRTISNSDMNDLCADAAGSGFRLPTMGMPSARVLSLPSSDVWFGLSCEKAGSPALTSQIIAKVSLTGSSAPSVIAQLNVPTSTYTRMSAMNLMTGPVSPISVNPTATGSAPMVTAVVIPTGMGTFGPGKIVRITAAGAVTSTDLSYAPPVGTSNLNISVSDYNVGDVLVVANESKIVNGQPANTTSLLRIPATGADVVWAPTWDNDADLTSSDPQIANSLNRATSIIGKLSTGETVVVRRVGSNANGGYGAKFKLAKINFATGAVTTFGELINTTYSQNSVQYFLPLAGNGAAFISQNAGQAGTWNALIVNGQSSTPTPTPTVPVPTQGQNSDLGLGLNAGGNKIEITGTLLTAVTGVTFNGVALPAGKFVKTATKITITVPAGTKGSVPVALVYAGGTIPVGNYEYIGATKVVQNIAISAGSEIFSVGDADRILAPTSTYDDDADENTPEVDTGLSLTIVSRTPAVCTVTPTLLHFEDSGTCIIEGTQAGNARFAAGQKVTKVFYVAPTYTGASSLYSTDGGKPTITLTGTGLTSVTSVMIGNQVVTGVKSNATGTLLTVKIPVADQTNASVDSADLKLVYGNPANSQILDTLDDFTYVGGTKIAQTINLNNPPTSATYGDGILTLAPTSKDANDNVLDVVISIKSTTPTVCTVDEYEVTFKAGGVCKLIASQAGNAGVAKAADVAFPNITVAKKDQVITIADTTLAMTDVQTISAGVSLDSEPEMEIDYAVDNEDVCTVDGDGMITGVGAGTCLITVSEVGDARYNAATSADGFTITVVVTAAADPADIADAEGDGNTPAASIGNGGLKTFTATNDPGFQLAWDKASGKLIPRATGIYTGFIQAKLTFTANGVTYTCTNVFGSNAALKNKKPAEKKAAKASKVFSTTAAFCTDANEIKSTLFTNVALTPTNFAKVKPSGKATGAVGTVGTKKYESEAFKKLKNFTGPVSIEIRRFRAWPTTGVNVTGDKKTGKKIPVTTRNTSVVLQ